MIKKSELFDNKQYTCDLWKWVSECKKDNSFSKGIYGYFKKNQNNIQSENNKKTKFYFDHAIYESNERGLCLNILGWPNSINNKPKYLQLCQSLEKDNQYLRAIMIAVFHFDFIKAL